MKQMTRARKINIFLNIGIYASLLGSVISLYTARPFLVWVFLATGLLFWALRNLSFILEKMEKTEFGR